jgi:hypothetical protein
LWDRQVAAAASDNVTVEAFPMARDSLHRRGIALLGLVLGEMFDFEALVEDCPPTAATPASSRANPSTSPAA